MRNAVSGELFIDKSAVYKEHFINKSAVYKEHFQTKNVVYKEHFDYICEKYLLWRILYGLHIDLSIKRILHFIVICTVMLAGIHGK